jgi:hypothetical protein
MAGAPQQFVPVANTVWLVQVGQKDDDRWSSRWGSGNTDWCHEVVEEGVAQVVGAQVDRSTLESTGNVRQ